MIFLCVSFLSTIALIRSGQHSAELSARQERQSAHMHTRHTADVIDVEARYIDDVLALPAPICNGLPT